MEFTVTVSGWEEEGIEEAIVTQVVSKIADSLQERVVARIAELVDERGTALVTELLSSEVAKIVEGGWTETEKSDSYYGAEKRVKYTVREKIEKALLGKNDYNRYYDSSLPAIVDKAIKEKFDAEIKDGAKRLRAKVDEIINSTIEETITGDIRSKLRGVLARA